MSKKLEKNGLWESSRLMLPEHKARILQSNRQDERRKRPVLDACKLDEIDQRLRECYETGERVELLLWDPYENRVIAGAIAKIDPVQGRMLVSGEWVKSADILEASRPE